MAEAVVARHKPWYTVLYLQVLIAIAVGIVLGHFWPDLGKQMRPFGDGFVALIRMMIAPVIFCTVVHGIASMRDMTKVGRVGLKTLVYFEVVSTVALIIGLVVGELVHPGAGFGNFTPSASDTAAISTYAGKAKEESIVAHLLAIIPNSFFGALATGDLLQVLLVAILTGFVVSRMGELGERIAGVIEAAGKIFFGMIGVIVRVAPLGAFGAMAFTIGAFGVGTLWNLVGLIATFYLTSLLFVLLVLGGIEIGRAHV